MLLRACVAGVIAFTVLACCACGTATSRTATSRTSNSSAISDARLYHRSGVASCLLKRHVVAASVDRSKFNPSVQKVQGFTGAVTFLPGPIEGLPDSGPIIDAGALVFLRTQADARRREAQLAETFVYHEGEGPTIHALQPSPPTKADLASVERVDRNVIVFWQWPRQHAKQSDSIIDACLAASLR